MRTMTPGAATAVGVGLGVALAPSIGAIGWAVGLGVAAMIWLGTKRVDRR